MPAMTIRDYIDTIEAVDAQTVLVKAKLDEDGKAVNPLMVVGLPEQQLCHPESLDPNTGSAHRWRCGMLSKPIPVKTSFAPVLTIKFFADDTDRCPRSG